MLSITHSQHQIVAAHISTILNTVRQSSRAVINTKASHGRPCKHSKRQTTEATQNTQTKDGCKVLCKDTTEHLSLANRTDNAMTTLTVAFLPGHLKCHTLAKDKGKSGFVSSNTFFENKNGFEPGLLETSQSASFSLFLRPEVKTLLSQTTCTLPAMYGQRRYFQNKRSIERNQTKSKAEEMKSYFSQQDFLKYKGEDGRPSSFESVNTTPQEREKVLTAFAEGYHQFYDNPRNKTPLQLFLTNFNKAVPFILLLVSFGLTYRMLIWWKSKRDSVGGESDLGGLGSMSDMFFNQNSSDLIQPETVTVKFDDVKGVDEAKQELEDVVYFLRNSENFESMGAKLPKGVLLKGPPGTGKTLLAKAVAGEAGVPFFSVSGSSFDEMLVGSGMKRVKQLFAKARKAAPSVIFIDEIDVVGGERSSSQMHPFANQTITQLLAEMDGFTAREGVIVIGATNYPDLIDKALLRPGRFDVEVRVGTPDKLGREQLFTLYLSKVKTTSSPPIDVSRLAAKTTGMTGADIANLVNQAALHATREKKLEVTMEDLDFARDKVTMGPAWKNKKLDEETLWNTACHEAGHALVAHYTKDALPLDKVTILPRGHSLGHTSFMPDKEQFGRTMSELQAQMDVAMGGNVGEEMVFGDENTTSGASNDFKQATQIADSMVRDYGMSEKVGKRSFSKPKGYDAYFQADPDESDNLSDLADAEISRLLNVLPGSSKATGNTESLQDRVAKQRAITAAFISEHCLPFTLAPELLDFAKRLSEDKQALDKTTISKSSATYINTHGVAKSLKNDLKQKLKGQMLSLNADEATNNNNDKILNVIAQYYDEESSQIEIVHLGSRKQNMATAVNILESMESILIEYELEWLQVASVLMDNCSTMRGIRGGVETLIRKKNPYLLDVSGDTVHMVNNVAKTLLNCVDKTLPIFAMDLFYDIEESPKVQEIFSDIQSLMNVTTPKHLIRPISSRFLQMMDVTSRLVECTDTLTVYYYSFLSEEEKENYRPMISNIFQDHGVSDEAQAAIILLQLSQESQQKSSTSNERKERILSQLFQNRRETLVKLNLFRGLLSVFHGFVKKFQSEAPLIHTLHQRMVDVTSELLGMFMKPEHIPDSVTALTNLDIADKSLQKPDKELGVGKYAASDINKARVDKSCRHWLTTLYSDLRNGYVMAAQKILKMPLTNKVLRRLSALDPEMASHSQASSSLKRIANSLPNLINSRESGELAVEIDNYTVDHQVKDLVRAYSEDDRIDTGYWVKVFQLKTYNEARYPMLKKLVTTVLTIFSGPLIEATFNIMDDIVEKDRTKLTVENYEAIAIVKTALKRQKLKSTTMKINRRMVKCCIAAYSTYQSFLKKKKEIKEAARATTLNNSIQLLKLEKAKRLAKLVRLKNRLINRKRKSNVSSVEKRQWKRIKVV